MCGHVGMGRLIDVFVLSIGLLVGLAACSTTRSGYEGFNDIIKQHISLKNQHRNAEAELVARRMLETAESLWGPDHLDVALSLNALADDLIGQNRPSEAIHFLERALVIMKKSHGRGNSEMPTTLARLANCHMLQGKYAKAEEEIKYGLSFDAGYPIAAPVFADSLRSLAIIYERVNKDPIKASWARKIADSILAKWSQLEQANAIDNQAQTLEGQRRYHEAEEQLKRGVSIVEQALGTDDPRVAHRLGLLAIVLTSHERLVEAEPLIKRGLAILDKTPQRDNHGKLNQLGTLSTIYAGQGRELEAEQIMKDAVLFVERSLVEGALYADDPSVSGAFTQLASFYRMKGRNAEADPLEKRAQELGRH
jgi:tetratricopeptide (TPR) repeat protein